MQEQSLGPSPMQRGRAQPSQVRKEAALSDCTCVTWSAWTRFYKDARGKHELLPRASFFAISLRSSYLSFQQTNEYAEFRPWEAFLGLLRLLVA
jgi:hypothetical protein